MTVASLHSNDLLLGYTLEKRIGSGGFGEVWQARAPGGLPKAIKIVYGFHDDDRALSERKALSHVLELRHPFLLSLERIDIHDGRLIVVTELADGSLKHRFLESVRKGNGPGIPRDELLRYIRDAADGLDYLCEKHLLQHLDVKPENLLLVGDHVKVADYGLVKDVRNATCSLLQGMTPSYAAPELFDGRPSQVSDQYSLAVVYQEMLTGVRPFGGKTPAELARQHLKERPNLEPLPRGDQLVVAKALSKDPAHRFHHCLEFVGELLRRRTTISRPMGPVDRLDDESTDSSFDATQIISGSELPRRHKSRAATRLPDVPCDGSHAAFHPTLLIGVGRLGTMVLRQLRGKIFARFGRVDHLPAIRMLCLDSDGRDLCDLSGRDDRVRFQNDELLSIPLRNPEAYRKTGEKYSRWLSRRWIYNIPRSLSTEGIRPLGRLALADHMAEVLEQLHQKVPALANEADLLDSARHLELRPDPEPRVFLVGSISGGIGSGAIPDLAYAIRTVLLEHGLSDRHITGVLVHASADSSTDTILSVSNSYACIRELAHYAKLGYPGDESMGLPSFDGESPAAFSDIYFLRTRQSQLETTAARIAEYLFLDVHSGCNEFFKQVRPGRDTAGRQDFCCLGISHLDLEIEHIRSRFASHLRKRLFARWLTASPEESPQPLWDAAVQSILQELSLDKQLAVIGRRLATDRGADVRPHEEGFACPEVAPAPNTGDEFDWIEPAKPIQPAADPIAGLTRPLSTAVWSAVAHLLDDSRFRLAGTRHVHRGCQEALTRKTLEIDARLAQIADQLAADQESDEPGPPPERLLNEMKELQFVGQAWRRISQDDEELVQELHSVRAFLESSSHAIEASLTADTFAPSSRGLGASVTQQLGGQVEALLEELDATVDKDHFAPQGGLRHVVTHGSSAAGQLADFLEAEVRQRAAQSLRAVDIDRILQTELGEADSLRAVVAEKLQEALPSVGDCGGSVRLLIATPKNTSPDRLAATAATLFRCPPTFLNRTDGEVVFCFESGELSSSELGLRLIDECPEATRYVERIPGRSDVEWIPLTGLA